MPRKHGGPRHGIEGTDDDASGECADERYYLVDSKLSRKNRSLRRECFDRNFEVREAIEYIKCSTHSITLV